MTNNKKLLTDKQLRTIAIKNIKESVKNEVQRMLEIVEEFSKGNDIPLDWRKMGNESLSEFVLKNRHLTNEQLMEELKKH